MGKKSYAFGLISDVHIDREGGGERAYFRMAEDNFADALRFFRERDTVFILSAGDQITAVEGVESEWAAYRRIIRESGYERPIFAAFGNHEARPAAEHDELMPAMKDAFLAATREHRGFGAGDGLYYSFDHPTFGDRFIVMACEGGMDVPHTDAFTAAQLDWVEELLESAQQENRRVFLIQHASVYGCGVGDDLNPPVYKGSLHTGKAFPMNTRFMRILERYPQTIWLSGHTHIDLRDGVNYRKAPDSCHMIHIPALCGTKRLISGDGGRRVMDRTFRPDTAQAYLVRVDEDRAEFIGVNCNTGEELGVVIAVRS